MLRIYKNAQFYVTTRHVASCDWWICNDGPCRDTSTTHHSPRDELWHKIVHFYVLLTFLFKLCLYLTHIYTLSHVNCGAEITLQYALSVVTKV